MYEKLNEKLEHRYHLTEYPLNIAVEVTNYCNLNCIMCGNDKIKRPRGFMSVDLYKRIIDETARENSGTRIWLDFDGEALLAGWKLYFMIDYAKKQGIKNVCINTNGTLLKKEYADMLLDSGIDYISIDCDGYSKEVYESIRVKGNRDVLYSNVEYLLTEKKRRGSKVIIDVKVIDMPLNHTEVDQIVRYWKERGAWTAIRRCGKWVGVEDACNPKDEKERIACGHGVGTAAISWDGIVAGCAWDCDLQMACGDINVDSIKKIWKKRNESFLKLQFEHRWEELPLICQKCSDWKNIGEIRYDENGDLVERNYNLSEKMW